MNTLYCHNCGGAKINIENPWCETCQTAVNESREGAAKEGQDVGEAQRRALRERAHSLHQGHADSRTMIQRTQYNDFLARKAVLPGAPDDPRRGRLPPA